MTALIRQVSALHLLLQATQLPSANAATILKAASVSQVELLTPQNFLGFYERHYEEILNYLFRRTWDREQAADLTSETFVQALRWVQRAGPLELKVRPWLYQVATRCHLQHARRQRRWHQRLPLLGHLSKSLEANIREELLQKQECAWLHRRLLELPERDKTPLMLRFFEDLPYDEIAEVLQITPVAARSRVSRALARLARRLQEKF